MILSEIYNELNKNNFNVVDNEIKRLNRLYRNGEPEISDKEYDKLLATYQFVNPHSDIFKSGIIEDDINPNRKDKLKYPMFSLDKLNFISEVVKWITNKKLPLSTILVCTAKYDGISILKDEWDQLAWSRGDGNVGETMHDHYKKLNDNATKQKKYTIGELLFPKHIFSNNVFYKEDGTPYKNARNMMGGLKNSDTPSNDLQYVDHIRYGFADEDYTMDKVEQLNWISKNIKPIPYKTFRVDQLDTDELTDLFISWSVEYTIDGLVIEINDKNIRKQLGREKNNNPAYSRAFKNPDWAEKTETGLRYPKGYPNGIEWNISKTGKLAPVALLEPFDIEGVTIKRATCYNAKFVKDNNIGKNCRVEVIRSGSVIPKIISVIKSGDVDLPETCPSCNKKLQWSETNVDLVCLNSDCPEIKFLKLTFFFVKYKIAGFAEKTIRKFFNAGYDTVGKILRMSNSDIEMIDGMAGTSSTKILKEIKDKILNTTFYNIAHASGVFENLGSKKIKMIYDGIMEIESDTQSFSYLQEDLKENKFNILSKLLSKEHSYTVIFNKIIEIKGVSDKTAEYFLNGLIRFNIFISDLNMIKISEEQVKKLSDDCKFKQIDFTGREFVFTGIRDNELKTYLEINNAIVKDSISKSITDLITKNTDTTSSKAIMAIKNGATVWQIDKFKETLK